MANLRRSISSLGALATFEATARLGSFTLAAKELGVTQAAVSRQIKLLETELNTPLFIRAHRRVALTAAGAAFAGTVSRSFGQIAEMIETLRQPTVPAAVTISATLAFTHFWLLPRLSDFRAAHPDINLKLVAEDGLPNVRQAGIDVMVQYGPPVFDGATSLASRPDEVFPVCSPALLARLGVDAATARLDQLPLITSDWVDPTWLTWRRWAKEAGSDAAIGKASDQSGLRFNHYTDTIQAAMNGEGVALGWHMLLTRPLAEGRLIRVGAASVMPAERYHVFAPTGRTPTPAVQAFLDWICARIANDP